MKTVKLSTVKPHPDNPRFIRTEAFDYMKRSIAEDPGWMRPRPVVAQQSTGLIIGGEMRWRALKDLTKDAAFRAAIGTTKAGEVPMEWIHMVDVDDETAKRLRLKDNGHYGENDWDKLCQIEPEVLVTWGVDVPVFGGEGGDEPDFSPGTQEEQGKLDELSPKICKCPHCGKDFDLRQHEQG